MHSNRSLAPTDPCLAIFNRYFNKETVHLFTIFAVVSVVLRLATPFFCHCSESRAAHVCHGWFDISKNCSSACGNIASQADKAVDVAAY